MKYLTILFSLIILLSIGCDKADEFTQFEMEYTETVTIESSSGINLPFDVFTPDVETNSETKFEVNDTRKDLVEEITIKQIDLTITSPSDGDFSFLKSIEVYLNAEGLDEIRVAWKENINNSVGDYIELDLSDKDLKEYIKKDEFSLRLKTVTDEAISQDHDIEVHSIFFVDAEVLGQ